jgi:hypothetical protein
MKESAIPGRDEQPSPVSEIARESLVLAGAQHEPRRALSGQNTRAPRSRHSGPRLIGVAFGVR